ncbi:TipJ family phage tail tip protein [Stutzerimonas degradans]
MTAVIKGAKGGSSKQRTPVESPDSLVSTAYARLIDLISEGEIYGLVNGSASIYLDETPASTSGGSSFSGFRWEQRTGSQDQSYLAGFPQVENEITIGVELQASSPWVRSITNADLSAVRINFSVPRLARQNTSNGDTTGYRVDYAIDVAIGLGAYQEVLTGAFNGKTTGGYERSVRIDLPEGSGGWRVRVRRLTPNSTSSAIADTVSIKSFTEIIDAKFRYPNSAIVGVSFDAETFGGSVPRRGYHARGRIIRVPSNYAPESRTYTGIWDGTFQLAYSNNPAWIYYDLLLHPRYGLGDRIDASQVDKWGLYQIGQYCDQLVSDGQGGMEPRFVCNLYLQKRADAYKALQDIAAVFRGITYWGAGQAIVSADMPADPVYTYTNANVKNGKFSYKGSKRSTRYSAVLVGWNDPSDMYRQKVEYVQDDDAIARFGVQTTEITALGCTSQGQAQRAGRWALLTNLLETETVTFSVGLDGIRARPGQIIRVADNARAGRRIGGRLSAATATVITVDKVEGVQSGDELTCILPSGVAQTRSIVAVEGHQLTVAPAFDAAPVAQSVWAWESTSLAAQRYRIVSIAESGPLEYAITASKYVEGKHAAVDSGAIISQRPITAIPSSVQAAPTNIRAISDWMIEQTMAVTTMTILWDAAPGATRYDVEWKRGDGAWVYAGRVGGTEIDVVGIYAGTYQIRVRALNSLDVTSPWGYSGSIALAGKAGTPPAVAFLNAVPEVFGIRLEWGFPAGAEDTLRTEIQYGSTQIEQDALHLGDYAYPANTHTMTGLSAGITFWFRARLIDRTGNIGPWSGWVMGQSSADATAILEYIAGQISETELGQNLLDRINLIDGDGPGSVNDRIRELTDALEYSPHKAYQAGDSVRDGQRLYQAKIDVPADPDGANAPPNATYWLDIGQVVQSANGLALQVEQNTASLELLDGKVTAAASSLEVLQAAYRDDDGEGDLADALNGWDASARITQESRTRASENSAMAERLTQLQAQVTDEIGASITEIERVIADEFSAVAETTEQLQAAVGENSSAIQTTQQTVASLNGDLSAMYSVKLQLTQDGKYYAAGMGLGIENTPTGMQSQVLFQADRFAVINTANGVISTPFVIQGGQVFINSAVIGDGTIDMAKIATALQSTNYVAGQQGWRLDKAGTFEINGSVAGQGRMQMTHRALKFWDGNNVLRVQAGDLSA